MNKPLISVIVPVYNAEQYLRKCLDSIISQTYSNLEIICINDGSTDSSGCILDEYASKDSRFRIIHKANEGQAAGRNDALNIATGDLVANVDSDDYLEHDAYERVVANFTDEVDMVWFGNNVVGEIEGKALSDMEEFYRIKRPGVQSVIPAVFQHMSMAVWNKVVRREMMEKYQIRYPHGMLFEDVCVVSMMAAVMRKICFLPDKLYNYYQRGNSTMADTRDGRKSVHMNFIKILAPMYTFYEKWGLLNKRADLYNAFLTRCYNCIKAFSPQEEKREALLAFLDFIKENRIGRLHTVSGVMHDLGLQLHRRNEKCIKYFGVSWYSKLYHKGTYSHALLGWKLWKNSPAPSPYKKNPFYHRAKGTKAWRLFWLPILTMSFQDGVQIIKLFNLIPVYKTTY